MVSCLVPHVSVMPSSAPCQYPNALLAESANWSITRAGAVPVGAATVELGPADTEVVVTMYSLAVLPQ